jgi:hypothetical protein
MKILKVGENIEICGLKYIVYDSLYCMAYSGHNNECFKIIDVDKKKFTTNILGYYKSGDFPYCNSLEDLTKLVNALNEEYDRQQGKTVEKLVQTNMNQEEACFSCKYIDNCNEAPHIGICPASDGQHYPKVIEETKKYDFSTTITRAVENNDPNIIAIETGKSIKELCKLVEAGDNKCLRYKLDNNHLYNCDNLMCFHCPLSELTRNLSKSEIISWLKSNSLEVKTPEFKVGDWVTMIRNYSVLQPGEIYQLVECQDIEHTWWYVNHPTIVVAPRANKDFRHATKEEIESVTKTNKPFEYNKWYKQGNILEYFSSEDLYYGFDVYGNWFSGKRLKDGYTNDYLQINQSNFIPVSDEEAKERLLEYAIKKHPIGTKLKECLHGWVRDTKIGIIKGKPYWDPNGIWAMGSIYELCIYLDGKWAEIESKPIQKNWVKCNTQEEWDFVSKKLGRTDPTKFKIYGDCINLLSPNTARFNKPDEYYTFEEWLELSGISIGTVELVDNGTIESTTIEYIKQQEGTNRNIPIVDNIQNRFKVSPVRKRNLPEIY